MPFALAPRLAVFAVPVPPLLGVETEGVEDGACEFSEPVPDGLLVLVSGVSELSAPDAAVVFALHHVFAAVGVPPVLVIRVLNGLALVKLGELGFCAN